LFGSCLQQQLTASLITLAKIVKNLIKKNMNISRVKKVYLIVILSFLIVSWKILQDSSFVFQKESQKLELKIENGMNYIKWNTKTKFTIKTENIDQKKLMLAAPGLKILKPATELNNESLWEIIAEKVPDKKDTLTLFITGRDLKDSVWNHKFKILIK
jgi:hypothetical protein